MKDMKKNILLLFALYFVAAPVFALTDVEVSGEVNITASAWNLPTGERGNSAYSIPGMFINIEAPLQEDNILYFQIDGSEEKTSSVERFDLKVRQAYLDVVSVFQGAKGLRLGLVPHPWLESQYELWPYRFLGSTSWGITEKWRYLNFSDLGFTFRSEFAADIGDWALTLTNGEGPNEKEVGPRKDASLFVRLLPNSQWSFYLNYLYGAYEKYDVEFNKKERFQALINYQFGTDWQMGIEYFKAQDPADAVRVYQMADGVTVTDLTGQSIIAQGGCLYAIVSTGPLAEVLLRYDYLKPADGISGRDVKTALAALGYRVTEDIKVAFAMDYSEYGKDFAPGERDRSKIEAAAQVLF